MSTSRFASDPRRPQALADTPGMIKVKKTPRLSRNEQAQVGSMAGHSMLHGALIWPRHSSLSLKALNKVG